MAEIVCRRSLCGEERLQGRRHGGEFIYQETKRLTPSAYRFMILHIILQLRHFQREPQKLKRRRLQMKDLPPQPSLGDNWMQFWGKDTMSIWAFYLFIYFPVLLITAGKKKLYVSWSGKIQCIFEHGGRKCFCRELFTFHFYCTFMQKQECTFSFRQKDIHEYI